MKKSYSFILKTLDLVTLIILYYIVGRKSIFLYVMSLSLYNIFLSCFSHISISRVLGKLNSNKSKSKVFKTSILIICTISMLFLLLSVVISDIVGILLNINSSLIVFVLMGLSILIVPVIRITSEYFVNIYNSKYYKLAINIYYIIEKALLLIIALVVFRFFKINNVYANALLYSAKIISFVIVLYGFYRISQSRKKENMVVYKEKLNYKTIFKEIFTDNISKSFIDVVKKSYYYFSIIILYSVLKTRYGYIESDLEVTIVFIYFYALSITNYLIYLVKTFNQVVLKEKTITSKIYTNFRLMLTIAIIFGIISPLVCKVIFNNPSFGLYLIMTNFMAIFILLYDITYENISNKKVMFGGLILGYLSKIILVIPLINAFYRMGYNLVFGDIISTIIAQLISVIINYVYIKAITNASENHFSKVLNILYENILLCIILILLEFIIPIDTNNYFKALGLIIVYIAISLLFIKLKKKKG